MWTQGVPRATGRIAESLEEPNGNHNYRATGIALRIPRAILFRDAGGVSGLSDIRENRRGEGIGNPLRALLIWRPAAGPSEEKRQG